jgi:hypothetical protein
VTAGPDEHERALAARVVSTLLRENYGHLADRVCARDGHTVLRLRAGGGDLLVPLEPDGFLADLRVPAGTALTLDQVQSAVEVLAGPRDAAGAGVFEAECQQALAEARLRARQLAAVPAGPAHRWAGGPVGGWLGPAGQLRFDLLAAGAPHPAYPASPCRMGLGEDDLLRYAPEFGAEFELRWAAVPRGAVTGGGCPRAVWWPEPGQVGLPGGLAATHELFPVHPLAVHGLPAALGGLPPSVLIAPRPCLRVRPTLSVRTVAVGARPAEHLKLPMAMSTLGLRNLRLIGPATLADGALVGRLLSQLRAADPVLDPLLVADDTSYAHAGHPRLGYLLRRLPADLDGSQIVPVAALTAPAPGGRLVIEELAGPGRVLDFAAAYFRLVFGLAVRLMSRYGIALESHQQNAALVVTPGRPLRLLVKDFDGTLISLARLGPALARAPGPSAFADPRLLTDSDDALADVFVTITVHLCAGAIAFALAEHGAVSRTEVLAVARAALAEALDDEPGPAAGLLRARVLQADRLPGKSMVTAGTLTAKERTGAADINKYYGTTGPNYLKEAP